MTELPNLYPGISRALGGVPRYIMLGGGRQSVAMLLAAQAGLIGPKPDGAIFVNLGKAERSGTHDVLAMLRSPNFPLDIPLIEVTSRDFDADFENALAGNGRLSNPPMFTQGDDGSRGRLVRGCTRDYKIRPGVAKLKELMGYAKGDRMPAAPIVEQWLGFSADEVHRVSAPPEDWIHNRAPLIEIGWRVERCVEFVFEQTGVRVDHSGCWFCPFTNDEMWHRLKINSPKEFDMACDRDAAMRRSIPNVRQPAYIHDSLKPLREIDFEAEMARKKGSLLSWEDPRTCPSGWCGS